MNIRLIISFWKGHLPTPQLTYDHQYGNKIWTEVHVIPPWIIYNPALSTGPARRCASSVSRI